MYAVGRLGSYITRGVYTFSGPFHPFGGAMDIVVVQQEDGSFKSSPWYVRLGKFQGVLKANEKIVDINVNGAEANFHMYLYQRGEAFFMKEVDSVDGDAVLSPPSSSGEELDGKRVDRRPLKSVSLDYDFDQSNSVIDMSNVKRINSRRSRILGFVLGRKSMKEKRFQEGVEDSDVAGTESMECAEIAAGLLEVKWSTNLASIDIFFPKTSDVLGQFMPWSQTGVAHLFSAIKENGYQLLFLSARAISQSYQTRQFLFNIKQDRKCLPDGPVVISPDGLFPSLFREVIRRAPHEFKIACLEDIKACFPSDRNPFYAGFGKRDTDEFSDLKVGIPKGKIFIINPKEEVIVNRRIDSKSYTPLHGLVNSMFPPISKHEAEDYTRGISGNSHPLLLLLKCFCK